MPQYGQEPKHNKLKNIATNFCIFLGFLAVWFGLTWFSLKIGLEF